MNGKTSAAAKLVLTTVFALSPGPRCAFASADVYQKMADDFARYSTIKKIKNIAVLGFSRKAQTSREESEYVSEKLLAGLSRSGKMNLLERGQLDKVLGESRLGLTGVTQETPGGRQGGVNPTDVVITGAIFGTEEHLLIIAKMIDRRTGMVLHTVEAQAGRQLEMTAPEWSGEIDLPNLGTIAPVAFGKDFKLPFGDFRDAPAGIGADTCGDKRERLAGRQSAALEAKAKYWALKMKEPDFKIAGLTRNPGGEIKDKGTKKKFYELLTQFYRAPGQPQLSQDERSAVKSVMEEEGKVSDECGLD